MTPDVLAGHHHVYQPAPRQDARTLLLLHGTGGDEHDLLQLGRAVAPDVNLLSPRGRVLEHGMPRFFRRHGEGVLDVEDLRRRAADLARFVTEASSTYDFDAERVVGFGYSNGANIASAVLLTQPGVLRAAALARAMVPFEDVAPPATPASPRVLLLAGRRDPYSRSPVTERLADLLQTVGADVAVHWADAGHELTPQDVSALRGWLSEGQEART